MVTWSPRASRSAPNEDAESPFPSDETTPPVTKAYFGDVPSGMFYFSFARAAAPTEFRALARRMVRIAEEPRGYNEAAVPGYAKPPALAIRRSEINI
jgi:hypothetical protein